MNYIKRIQDSQTSSVSVGNHYSEDQIMHILLGTFHQGGKYSSHISSHQAEIKIEETVTDHKCLSILSLHTNYLNLDSSSGSGRNNEREKFVQTKYNFCWGTKHYAEKYSKRITNDKEVARAAGDSHKQ